METEQQRGTSPWVYVGIGCLLAIFLVIVAVGSLAFWGYRQVRNMQAIMDDPVARTEKALDLLGTDALPDGYYAAGGVSIPFLMDAAILSDKAPDENGRIAGFDQRGFIYFKTRTFGPQEQELRDFFEGRTDDSQLIDQTSIRIRSRDLIGRGSIEEAERTLRWVTYRGEIGARGAGRSQELGEGLTAMILFDCGGDDRVRMAIWFGPDPDPDTAPEDAEFAGSVADEAEIQRFVRNFDVCSR